MERVRARPAEDSGYNSRMQIYLVGGAVRDQLLGLPVRERDWVVVGATPGELEKLGYRRVGRDFPVYLHPETSEEYALARTERKTGPGYRGFEVHADPSVTLEEDLQRRDLTINAMAQTADGRDHRSRGRTGASARRACCTTSRTPSGKTRSASCAWRALPPACTTSASAWRRRRSS